MKILADQNMPLVEEYFAHLGHVTRFDGRSLTAEQLKGVDILLIRSVTPINEALLRFADQLKFVGTATIGTDHVDQDALAKRNIAFTNAPGCNAVAVAEFVISALCALSQQYHFELSDKVVGIVGVGNIGIRLHRKLQAIGIKTLLCDPFVQEQYPELQFVELSQLFQQADVISFHVPLIKDGPHATKHLLNEQTLSSLKPNAIVINASRGDVIDNLALNAYLSEPHQHHVVLDVWENEPTINTQLLDKVDFASVHIAGHTLEGKARGTQMLYQALSAQLDTPAELQLSDFLPTPAITNMTVSASFEVKNLPQLVHSVYDIRRDDGIVRAELQKKGFDFLRKNYPIRREFSALTLECATDEQALMLSELGFTTSNTALLK